MNYVLWLTQLEYSCLHLQSLTVFNTCSYIGAQVHLSFGRKLFEYTNFIEVICKSDGN